VTDTVQAASKDIRSLRAACRSELASGGERPSEERGRSEFSSEHGALVAPGRP